MQLLINPKNSLNYSRIGRVKEMLTSLAGDQVNGAFKRGEAPLLKPFPLSFEGEGDTGGEVDKHSHNLQLKSIFGNLGRGSRFLP